MKRGIIVFIWVSLFAAYSCGTADRNNTGTFEQEADYIQIVLFHLEQRCGSCDAVELETRRLLEEEYLNEMQKGLLKFISLNFQTLNGKKAARLLRASGQTLFVVKGDSIEDLTSPAFMFAQTHPDRYLTALRETLDKYLE